MLPVDGPSGTRYRLLDTVREYAAGRLAEPELEPLRSRHAKQTRDLAVAANLALEQVAAGMSFEPIWDELPSIRAAIEWAIDADPALGVDIACALERFWTTGHNREGIDAFDALLAREALGEFARARALRCRGGARYASGDFAGGTADYDAAIAIHRRLGQPAYVAHLLLRNGVEALRQGDFERARRSLDEAEATGGTERFRPDRIIELSIRSDLAFEASLIAEGFELLRDAVVHAEGSGDDWWLRSLHIELADRGLEFGRLEVVGASAREALRLAHKLHDRQATIWALSMLARAASRSGGHERAGRIWGGLEAEGERGGRTGRWALEEEHLREELAAVGGEPFHAGEAAGRSMSLAETVIEATA